MDEGQAVLEQWTLSDFKKLILTELKTFNNNTIKNDLKMTIKNNPNLGWGRVIPILLVFP